MIISTDTTWHSGEVHDLSAITVQIAFGSTLTIEGGCTVNGGSIQAFGTLNVAGTTDSVVTLNNVSIGYNGPDIGHPGQVNITHANILGGYILHPTGNYVAGSISLIDSTITNLNGYIYLSYPLSDAHIEGNIFKNSGGISVGQGTRNSGEPYGSVFIKNNVFIGQTSGYAVENWASYSGATVVENNSFLSTNLIALSLGSGYLSSSISAANNYFGTTDIAVINAMIYDKTDDLSIFSVISNSYTDAPSVGTPILDETAPIVISFNPTDGYSTASINENITLTFNEPIQKGIGTIQILTDSANGKVIESFNAATSSNISISDHSLIINPTQSLSYKTHYFVTLASGTVEDLAGNDYQETATYDFTTSNTVTTALSSYTLSTKEPNDLTYLGSSGFAGTGNAKNNIITSSIGNDKLDGGKGIDTLIGGKGNDTYIVDSIKDIVVEEENSGIDTIELSVTFSLAALVNVENITLIGTKAINGAGNILDNTMLGNSANNSINGGLGNDILTGGNSADTFQFNTTLNSSTNVDTIADFVHGTDKIQLSKSIMNNLNSGTKLNPLGFKLSTEVLDASDRIIYDQSSGALSYDADGSGSVAAIQIAIIGVATHSTITATDFILAK